VIFADSINKEAFVRVSGIMAKMANKPVITEEKTVAWEKDIP